MSYVVNWQRSDGGQAWHPVGEVQEAATFAEHLRNAEGVEATRIYRLEQVGFAFKPYFRVELEVPEAPPVAAAVAEAVAGTPVDAVEVPVPAAPPIAGAEPADANGARRGLFGR